MNRKRRRKALVCVALVSCVLSGCGKKKQGQGMPEKTMLEGINFGAPTMAGDTWQEGKNPAMEGVEPGGQGIAAGESQSDGQGVAVGDSQPDGQGVATGDSRPDEQGNATEDSQSDGQGIAAGDSRPDEEVSAPGSLQPTGQNSSAETSVAENLQAAENADDFVIAGDTLLRYNGTAQTVIVPDGVRSIGAKAFYGNLDLTCIVLPEGILEICEDAFGNCRHLKEAKLPESLKPSKTVHFQIVLLWKILICSI